ncbi:glycosyltransferase [Inhella proteolytica]|uniref:Glycosyltransferase n=1 Tax=Inhella proteolytica TaxID=2795029 RepID=A0A931NIF9_9BURK|nr:glycosyltransferase [Inhella proteolytica]MBH9578014.1 glycosyltransferase [Inhella proteolytica]
MFGTFAEPELVPYQSMGPLPWRSLLVLAPHPDDEVFGCGGLLATAADQGVSCRVLVLTDGAAAGDAEVRVAESRRAATVLGYARDPDALQFLRHPDRELQPDEGLLRELRKHAEQLAADVVLAPSPFEIHPDHRAACVAAVLVARELQCPVLFYEVGQALMPNRLVDITAQLARKQAAMACFESQLCEQAYAEQILALNRFRAYTLGSQVSHAEAFWLLQPEQLRGAVAGVAEQLRQNLVARLHSTPSNAGALTSGPCPEQQATDQAMPERISVLVRSMDRDSLRACLAGLVAQRADLLHEVVVVNATGRAHRPLKDFELPDTLPLRLIEPGRALDRAAAANHALEQSQGELLLMLDDDDLVDPTHLERLHAALTAAPAAIAAYSGVRLVDQDGLPQGELDEPFDRLRLWCANYLPIHAVLFRRAALAPGQRFDERLPVYEDWAFWLQLAQRGEFVHVPGCSATYRLAGASGLGRDAAPDFVSHARARTYESLRATLSSETLERLLAWAESLRVQHGDALRHLDAERRKGQRQLQQLAEQTLVLQACDRELETTRRQAELDHQQAQQQVAEMQRYQHQVLRDLEQQRQGYQALEQAFQGLQASLSWRITAPLRAVRSWVSPQGVRRMARALPLAPARKQQVKLWLSSMPWGRTLLRRLAPGAPSAPQGVPPLDKEAVRRDAEAALDRFLASSGRLRFDAAGPSPQVSVIVVLYNQAGLTLWCLEALAASRGVRFELLVVDNASSDRVPALLQRIDGATLLPQTENLGFLRAVNLAAQHARGEHLLLLNNDAVVEPDTLAHALERLQAEPDVGAVGGPIMLWDGRLQEAGSIVWNDGSCLGYGRGDDPDSGPYRFVRDVDYCSGAFLMVRHALWRQCGGFDERYAPAYYEESDLCMRLIEGGYRIVYDPRVRVRHFEFASDAGSGRALELQARNRVRFADAHQSALCQQQDPDGLNVLRARQRLKPGACRVLVVDDRTPLPWLGQGYPRACSLVQALAGAGHAVTHYPLQFPHEDWADVYRALPERVEVMLDLGLAGLEDFLSRREGHYQLLIVSRPHNMQALSALRARRPELFAGLRWVYDAEALFSLREIVKASVQGRPLSNAQQRRLVSDELDLVREANTVLAVSDAEATHYRAAGFADVRVLGHSLMLKPTPARFEERHGFLFVGAIQSDDSPNGDSLLWFAREVWPLIEAELGDTAHLDVVGPCDSAAVRALANARIRVHGRVDHLDSWLNQARVFLAPTRFAAGIPHKAHEAAAAGLPVAASSLIAQQLSWQEWMPHGSTPLALAQACVKLHTDAAYWSQMRAQALEAVAEDCDPSAFERQVLALLPD